MGLVQATGNREVVDSRDRAWQRNIGGAIKQMMRKTLRHVARQELDTKPGLRGLLLGNATCNHCECNRLVQKTMQKVARRARRPLCGKN